MTRLPSVNTVGAYPDPVRELSVVVPIYNEEAVLPIFAERLRPVLDDIGCGYEVVAVDDGSTDATPVLLQRLRREWPELRIVRLRANAGHQAAISAGIRAAVGDHVVTIDADLQDPPETIATMLQVARDEQVDVVYGVRSDRSSDTVFKRRSADAYYRIMSRAGANAPRSAGDFRLMSRATVDAVNSLPEHHRVLRLVVPALGFPSAVVDYRRDERAAGESKYSLSHMVRLSLDSITSFSIKPLRMATWFGLFGCVLAIGLLLFAIIAEIGGNTAPGWTSIVMAVAGFGALQLLCLGMLGEYVGRTYLTMQGRPTYFVAYDSAATVRDPDLRAFGYEEADTASRDEPSGRRAVTKSVTPGSRPTGR